MAAPTPKRAMRQLSVQEKISAVQRVHDGESKASVARMIGVPESTLRGWCKNEMKLRTMTDRPGGCHSQSPSPSPPLPAEKRPRLDTDMDDALWFWLRNQQRHRPEPEPEPVNNNNLHHSSWFWKWYKEFGVPAPPPAPEEPLPLVVRRNKVSSSTITLTFMTSDVMVCDRSGNESIVLPGTERLSLTADG